MEAGRASLSLHLAEMAPEVRAIVRAARRVVKAAAPGAEELACTGARPRSASMMWKIARYLRGGVAFVVLGTFTKHSSMFFPRGRELDDGSGLLEGGGKQLRYITLRAPAEAARPAVKRMVRRAYELAGE